MAKPHKLRIAYEDSDHGRFNAVGCLPGGTQFMAFVTGAFPTGLKYYLGEDWRTKKKWLATIHRFDAEGKHLATAAKLGGFDIEGPEVASDKAFAILEDMFADLYADGQPEFCDIWVQPFAIEIDEVTHGLMYERNEEDLEDGEEPSESVMLEPIDVMFHPPWDSSEYST